MGFRKYEKTGGFGTPSKKLHLYWEDLEAPPWNQALPRPDLAQEYTDNAKSYPFFLISYRTIYHSGAGQWTHNNPQLRDRVSGFYENPLMINSRVAGEMGLADGDRVTIESPSGSIQVRVKLTEGIRPDCLGLAHGFGSTIGRVATAGEGVASNILIPDSGSTLEWQDVVGGESHVSTRVSIVK